VSHDGDRRRGGIPIYPPSIRISSSRAESDYGRIAGGAQKQSVLADYPSVAFFQSGKPESQHPLQASHATVETGQGPRTGRPDKD
jgi:hypothetical protein